MYKYAIIFVILGFLSCGKKTEEKTQNQEKPLKDITPNTDSVQNDSLPPTLSQPEIGKLEQQLISQGLWNVQDSIPEIFVDLKYSTSDNFIGLDVYGDLENAYLQPDVCVKLSKALAYLKKQDSSLSFLIYDAVRPRSVQQLMWDTLKMPLEKKIKFVSNPKNGSLHNYGAAVDITLCDLKGNALDMGAGFDDPNLIAWPSQEQHFLKTGELSQKQINNRILLRKAMQAGGFFNIQSEWWHFNSCYRTEAQSKYQIIE